MSNMKNIVLALLIVSSTLVYADSIPISPIGNNMQECEEWYKKFSRCPNAAEGFEPYHKWIVISKVKSPRTSFVDRLMCGVCAQQITTSEMNMYKDCAKTE